MDTRLRVLVWKRVGTGWSQRDEDDNWRRVSIRSQAEGGAGGVASSLGSSGQWDWVEGVGDSVHLRWELG